MVYAIRSAGTDVCGRNTSVLQECCVIGAATEISHGHIALDLCGRRAMAVSDSLCRRLRYERVGLRGFLPCLVDRATFGVGHSLGQIAQKLLEAGHRGCSELRP